MNHRCTAPRGPSIAAVAMICLGAVPALPGGVAASTGPAAGKAVPADVAARPHQRDVHLVACAPGYPGTTEGARETMDAFAAMLADAAGHEPGSVTAVYEEDEDEGVERIADPATGLALVPLPFFLKHGDDLDLRPLLQVVQASGAATEEWSLAARRGRVDGPASLAGWRIEGIPGYAPAFVRGPALGSWGALPDAVEIAFQPRVLSALRAAAGGDDVGVLLDRAQAEALDDLPMASELEIVTTSPPVPGALLVAVGERLSPGQLDDLGAGLLQVHEGGRFAEVLETLRLSRFTEVDADALQRARDAYRTAASDS